MASHQKLCNLYIRYCKNLKYNEVLSSKLLNCVQNCTCSAGGSLNDVPLSKMDVNFRLRKAAFEQYQCMLYIHTVCSTSSTLTLSYHVTVALQNGLAFSST